jgi:quinohemoprotein ethanol dehydrogenase
MSANVTYYQEKPDAPSEFVGFIQAWDPVAGKEVWRSEEGNGPTGGVLATAGGLVFQGGGNNTNEFRAFDAKTGEKVWSMNPYTGVVAAPITYELDGKQYVAASVGINQAGNYYAPNYARLLVFALDSATQLPEPVTYTPLPLDPPELVATAEQVQAGAQHYGQYCGVCHGQGGQNRGANFPNLMVTPMLHSQEGFDSIVLGGVRESRGMVSFAASLKPEDTAAIRAYLISSANTLKKSQAAAAPPAAPVRPADAHDGLSDETKKN